MTTLYNNTYAFRFIFVFILFMGIQISSLYAQKEDQVKELPTTPQQDKPLFDGSNPINPKITAPKLYSTNNRLLAYMDIAKGSAVSFYPKNFKVQQSKLNRKYYNNNIFDIDESDNPFALPIEGRKTKRKAKDNDKKNSTEILSELFAIKDDSTPKTPQWLIFILLGLLSFMSILVAIYRKEVGASFRAFFSTSAARNSQREEQSFLKMESFSSYILFVGSMGTFCFLVPQILLKEVQFNTFAALLSAVGGIAGVYLLKHLQLKILSFILPFPQEVDYYNFTISNTNKVLAYLLIPILFLLAYTPDTAQSTVLYGSFVLLGLIYVYRSLKGLAGA